jgi:hypothetical protein
MNFQCRLEAGATSKLSPHPMHLVRLFISCILASQAFAADLEPALGKKGKLLLEEKFDAPALPTGWNKNTGILAVQEGALHASELASDQHLGAFRKPLPLQDCAIQLDFKMEGATAFHVGFDPAPGALKKKGHLFSLMITPESWQITEHLDKDDAKSKNIVHTKAATKFARGETFTLLLEVKGNDVVARVAGKEPLRATAKDFHVKKPGLVFRVAGKGEHAVVVDNVRVWELLAGK